MVGLKMIIRANIKYSTVHKSWRAYNSNVVFRPRFDLVTNLIYLDSDLNILDPNEHRYESIAYILKYFYNTFSQPPTLRGTRLDNVSFYLFIPLSPYNDCIRVLNVQLADKTGLQQHLLELIKSDIELVQEKSNSDIK